MKKFRIILIAAVLFCSVSVWGKTPKYVFYFIGDGMGVNQAMATELYMQSQNMGELNFRHFPVTTFVTTFSNNATVTDSAAGGTALGSGEKVNNGAIGMRPDGTWTAPITDFAKRSGYAVGIISSDALTLATPAAFYGHAPSRNDEEILGGQLMEADIDFAGGPSVWPPKDGGEYWSEQARQHGYTVFTGKNAYKHGTKGKVLCLSENLKSNALQYALDNDGSATSLEDITAAAIDHLYTNSKKGFFLMAEGAQIDHAGHSQDPATGIIEIIDFSRSIDLAIQFYKQHPDETLIVVTADHETGYCIVKDGNISLVKSQKCSLNRLTYLLMQLGKDNKEVTWGQLKGLLKEQLGFWDTVEVSREEELILSDLYKKTFIDCSTDNIRDLYSSNSQLAVEAVRYLGQQAGVIYYRGSHSASPVGLYVMGSGAQEFASCKDNTDIAKTIKKLAKYK